VSDEKLWDESPTSRHLMHVKDRVSVGTEEKASV